MLMHVDCDVVTDGHPGSLTPESWTGGGVARAGTRLMNSTYRWTGITGRVAPLAWRNVGQPGLDLVEGGGD